MIRTIASAAVLLFLTTCICYGQQQTPTTDVYVKGWTVGNEIREQVVTFDLDSSHKEQTQLIRDAGINYFKLILSYAPARKDFNWDRAYWYVELKPLLGKYPVFTQNVKKEKLGDNLLSETGGGHYITQGNFVGWLYPKETKGGDILEKMLGPPFYPISSRRVVKVYDFFVIIKVNSYKMNDKNPKEIDSMNVTIEFKNHYKSGDECK